MNTDYFLSHSDANEDFLIEQRDYICCLQPTLWIQILQPQMRNDRKQMIIFRVHLFLRSSDSLHLHSCGKFTGRT